MEPWVVRRVERKHLIAAWVGDEERLNRVVRILGQAAERALEEGLGYKKIEVIATATERDGNTIRGDPVSVFGEMDRSSLLKLELEVGGSYNVGTVRTSFERLKGVVIDSRGEKTWVDMPHVGLAEELQRGRPSWWWMRTWQTTAAISLSTFIIAALSLGGPTSPGGLFGEAAWRTYVNAWAFAYAAGLLTWVGVRRVLPGFEVVIPGEKGKGGRALAIAGAVVLAASGVVIGLLRG